MTAFFVFSLYNLKIFPHFSFTIIIIIEEKLQRLNEGKAKIVNFWSIKLHIM